MEKRKGCSPKRSFRAAVELGLFSPGKFAQFSAQFLDEFSLVDHEFPLNFDQSAQFGWVDEIAEPVDGVVPTREPADFPANPVPEVDCLLKFNIRNSIH